MATTQRAEWRIRDTRHGGEDDRGFEFKRPDADPGRLEDCRMHPSMMVDAEASDEHASCVDWSTCECRSVSATVTPSAATVQFPREMSRNRHHTLRGLRCTRCE